MTDRVRVGIVGLGFGGRVLLPAFRSHAACEVAGVAAGRAEHAREAAAREGVAAYDTWQAMVDDPRIDAVVVAAPPALHAPMALAALRAGKHVFCEKPLADSVDAAERMAAAAAASRRANMVDLEFPDIPEWQQAQRLIAGGSIGRPRHVTVSWHVETYANRERLQNWKTDVAQGGGALNDFAVHTVYYLEWLLGPIEMVWAAPLDDDRRDVLVVLSLRFSSGATGAVAISTAAPLGDGHSVTIYGDDGAVALRNATSDYARGFSLLAGTRANGALQPVPVAWPAGGETDGRTVVAGRLADRFLTWIREGRAAQPAFADGLRVQTVLETAWRSRRQAAWCGVGR
jgi:predicted dehydrogenase